MARSVAFPLGPLGDGPRGPRRSPPRSCPSWVPSFTLEPEDYFGELSLFASQRNAVNVVALTPFVVYEIKKAMLEPMLRVDPLLLHELEAGAARTKTLIARAVAVQVSDEKTRHRGVVDRLRDFSTFMPLEALMSVSADPISQCIVSTSFF